MSIFNKRQQAAVALLMAACALAWADDPVTTITITDKVLEKDCKKFGINIGDDPYYGGPMRKKRVQENFEGSYYRQCLTGFSYDEEGFNSNIRTPVGSPWYDCLKGADFVILSGPGKGIRGKIKDFEDIEVPMYDGKQIAKGSRIVFDKKINLPDGKPFTSPNDRTPLGGILVENLGRTGEGFLGTTFSFRATGNCRLEHDDLRPEGFGKSCVLLDPNPYQPVGSPAEEAARSAAIRAGKTAVCFNTHYQRWGDTNGTWTFSFFAKAKDAGAKLTVSTEKHGETKIVDLSQKWEKYTVDLMVDKVPEPSDDKQNPHLNFVVSPVSGAVLLDDVEAWKHGDSNPTILSDECIAALKEMNVGVIRRVNMGGDTIENYIRPGLRKYRYQNNVFVPPGPYSARNPDVFGLHNILEVCEYLGAESWWCTPGTLHPEEMDFLMEYLGGPETTPGGKLRAELGHPRPWTETVKAIHLEIGNEAWNTASGFLAGGFNGPDYWKDLFQSVKKSPYYKPNILCHGAGQNFASDQSERIISDLVGENGKPFCDRYAVGLYQIHKLNKSDLDQLGSDEDKIFKWMMASPLDDAVGPFKRQMEVSQKHGVEFSMYEINHHITGGDAPLEARNKMVSSMAGGVEILNAMLNFLKVGGMRTQCLFTYQQQFYQATNVGNVCLWGANLSSRAGQVRYRPTGLAFIMANRVIGGNLLETKQEGADPKFSALIPSAKGSKEVSFPVLHSYAFSEGTRRGLIVCNVDTQNEQEVEIKFPGVARDVQIQRLVGDKISASNEYDAGVPQVKILEISEPSIPSGYKIKIGPCSMVALNWQTK